MKGWLVLAAVSVVFGLVVLSTGDDPVLDEPPGTTPKTHDPPPDAAAAPRRGPGAETAPSRAPAAPGTHPAAATPPPPDWPSPPPAFPEHRPSLTLAELRARAPGLADLLESLQRELDSTGTLSATSIDELTDLVAAQPETAGPAIDLLFKIPVEIFRLRPFLFQALINAEDPALAAAISRRIQENEEAFLAARPRTREALHAALGSGDAASRLAAVAGLSARDLKDPVVVDALRAAARDPAGGWPLQKAAIRALGRLRSPKNAGLLLDLLATARDATERAAVVRALGKQVRADARVAQALIDQIYDRRLPDAVRRFAVMGLARAAPSDTVKDALLTVLRGEHDIYLRRAAVRGLRAYRSDRGLRALLRAFREREIDPEVIAAIERILN